VYASALPRESRPSEICVEINRKPEEKHPCHNWKTDQQTLIIFGRNISDTTGY